MNKLVQPLHFAASTITNNEIEQKDNLKVLHCKQRGKKKRLESPKIEKKKRKKKRKKNEKKEEKKDKKYEQNMYCHVQEIEK